ncbi:NAD(P)-binding domain-containing protein [Nocardioides pacificus]
MESHEGAQPRGSIVIGAGQAGLSVSRHLLRLGVDHVVLDANAAPGGAWQHRARSLSMGDVHGIAELPEAPLPDVDPTRAARAVLPDYFAGYEHDFALPVERPVRVDRVVSEGDLLVVEAGLRRLHTRTLVNATGTWERPFLPAYPGAADFRGRQLHSSSYDGPGELAGQRVLVVGGGHSAVQILGEIAPASETLWVTRRPPLWRTSDLRPEDGRAAVALVAERVAQGLPPQSVVSVTGLHLREQEQAAVETGAYERLPMFDRIVADGVVWSDARHERVDVILWATGFRPSLGHLAPLRLRTPSGGVELDGTTSVADPRVQLVGYGPSASTIGANRAGRAAAVAVRDLLSRSSLRRT